MLMLLECRLGGDTAKKLYDKRRWRRITKTSTALYSTDDPGHSDGQKYHTLCACSPHRIVRRAFSRCDGLRIKTQAHRAVEMPPRPGAFSALPSLSGCDDPPLLQGLFHRLAGKLRRAGRASFFAGERAPSVAWCRAKCSPAHPHPIKASMSSTCGFGCSATASAISAATMPSMWPIARFLLTLRLAAESISIATFDICQRKIGCPP